MFDFVKYLWQNNNPWQRVGCIFLAICSLILISMVLFMFYMAPEIFIFLGLVVVIFAALFSLFYFSGQWEDFRRRTRKW